MDKIMKLVEWVMDLRPVRSFQRYGAARGNLLAGGIAYSALFAITGALVIGLTLFSYFLGGNDDLREGLFEQINDFMPGILQTADNPNGIVAPEDLIVDNPVNLASMISLVVLLWSSISLMTALRSAIQSMFGISRLPRNFVVAKLIDLSGFVFLAVGALAGVILTAGAAFFSEAIFEFIGLDQGIGSFFIQVASILVTLMIDMAIFAYMFKVMAGINAPRKDLFYGALFGGIGAGVLRILGTSAVSSVSDNPLLAPFAAIITLLLWINLLGRLALLSAAITSNPPAAGQPTEGQLEHANEMPNYVTKSRPDTLEWNFDPATGVVVADADRGEEDDLVPPWSGLREKRARRKVERAEERIATARAELTEAKNEYAEEAWEAYRTKTVPTTSAKLAEKDAEDVAAKAAKQREKERKKERKREADARAKERTEQREAEYAKEKKS